MAADLEQLVGHQLLRPLRMRLHLFAAGEEGRLDALRAQEIDDAAVIAGRISVLLAKIEGEGDQLLVGRQLDAADRAAKLGRDRRRRRKRHLLEEDEIDRLPGMHMLELSLGAGKRLGCPALRCLRLLSQCGRAAGERQKNKNFDKSPTHQAFPRMAFGQLDGMAGQ